MKTIKKTKRQLQSLSNKAKEEYEKGLYNRYRKKLIASMEQVEVKADAFDWWPHDPYNVQEVEVRYGKTGKLSKYAGKYCFVIVTGATKYGTCVKFLIAEKEFKQKKNIKKNYI